MAKDVDEVLAGLPAGQRAALQRLRETIRLAAPGAVDGFSYGLPAFRLNGRPLVAYGAAKGHCSFFPMSPALIEAHGGELAGYDTAKGTIRFTPEKPLPADLVQRIVRARVEELARDKRYRAG